MKRTPEQRRADEDAALKFFCKNHPPKDEDERRTMLDRIEFTFGHIGGPVFSEDDDEE